jgi:hypothetical protein
MLGHKQALSKSMLGHKKPLDGNMLGYKMPLGGIVMGKVNPENQDVGEKKSALEKRIKRGLGWKLGMYA